MKQFRSCAEWPAGHVVGAEPENTTHDEHETREAAEAVCRLLEKDGLGGERCHFPIRTWVEPIAPNVEVVCLQSREHTESVMRASQEARCEALVHVPTIRSLPEPNVSGALWPLLMACGMGTGYVGADRHMFRGREAKKTKCLLPGCDALTNHNGGYCCGDHCREHARIRKGNRHAPR